MTSPSPAEFGPQGAAYEEIAEDAVPVVPTDQILGEDNRGGLVEFDNAAHAPGRACELCGAAITASQDARLMPDGRWIHEACPLSPE